MMMRSMPRPAEGCGSVRVGGKYGPAPSKEEAAVVEQRDELKKAADVVASSLISSAVRLCTTIFYRYRILTFKCMLYE